MTTTDDLTEIAIILDRSGSMQQIKDDMDGGLWAMLVEQHGVVYKIAGLKED